MDFRKLTGFIAIAEIGSINAAAKYLGISQPALSKSLRALEDHYGVPLLVRDRSGVVPTEFGKTLLGHARVIRSEFRKAEQNISEMQAHIDKKLSIAIAPAPSIKLLPKALKAFQKELPGVILNIRESVFPRAGEMLSDGTIDIAIGPMVPSLNAAAFNQTALMNFPLAVVVNENHPLRYSDTLLDLLGANWLQIGGNSSASTLIRKTFESAGYPAPKSIVESHSILASLRLVRDMDLVSIMPLELLEDRAAAGLKIINVKEDIARNTCCMIVDQRRPQSRYAQAMVKHLQRASLHLSENYPDQGLS
ncbi:MAG: LysR family transcriptional regulator [Sulfitobacter sp.]